MLSGASSMSASVEHPSALHCGLRRFVMKPSRFFAKSGSGLWLAWALAVLGGLVPRASITVAAQSPPLVQGTIALEGTMKKVNAAANMVIVTTIDGVEHVVHLTKDLPVHGGKITSVD
jgi:hypothetical protein